MIEADVDVPRVRQGRVQPAVSLPLYSWLLLQWLSFVEREDTPLALPPPDLERRWSVSSFLLWAEDQSKLLARLTCNA